jgi:hypothetical protein
VAAVAVLAGLVRLTELATVAATENRSTKAYVLPILWVVWMHSVDLLLISRAGRDDVLVSRGEKKKKKPTQDGDKSSSSTHKNDNDNGDDGDNNNNNTTNPPFLRRLRIGLGLNWNWSRRGTRWQMNSVRRVREHAPPSRGVFLLTTACTIAWQYLVMDFASSAPLPPAELYAPRRQAVFSRLREVTADELASTVGLCLSGAVAAATYTCLTNNVVAFVAVLAGGASPDDFPRFTGSLTEAYSVARFWK